MYTNQTIHEVIKNSPKIAVFGSEGDHCSKQAQEVAELTGKLLAEHGAIVFNGALSGVMEASSKGASQAGGLVIGISPDADAKSANAYCSLVLPTEMGFARGQILANSVDGAILIEGGLGTHQEAAYMYWLQKPTVAIATSGGTAQDVAGKALDRRELPVILSAESAKAAVSILFEALNKE